MKKAIENLVILQNEHKEIRKIFYENERLNYVKKIQIINYV
jgi:hypothetical protein